MLRWNLLGAGLLAGVLTTVLSAPSSAHRDVFSAEEKDRLKTAERIHLDALALTTHGAVDAGGIASVAAARLKALGYAVTNEAALPHDVTVKVKCEERKTWDGPVASGGDADQIDAAARLWTGPACQITYRLQSRMSDWRHEVRGDAAKPAPTDSGRVQPGATGLAGLTARLADDPFPFLLAGAWGQPGRLLAALDHATTPPAQRTTIITLLGNMSAVDAIPTLTRTLNEDDPVMVQSAAVALGAIGDAASVPVLLEQLSRDNPEIRRAAIKGLGRLAPLHPNSPIVPALLAQLHKEGVSNQTEIVRALGKTTDRRILDPLRALNRSVQQKTRSDSSPEWKDLKQALGESLDQFDGVHTEE